jgi:hypothetical protein
MDAFDSMPLPPSPSAFVSWTGSDRKGDDIREVRRCSIRRKLSKYVLPVLEMLRSREPSIDERLFPIDAPPPFSYPDLFVR